METKAHRLNAAYEKERCIQIRKDAAVNKLSVYELADKYKLSPRSVFTILSRDTYNRKKLDNYGAISRRDFDRDLNYSVAKLLYSVGLTQKTIARYLGVSHSYVSKILLAEMKPQTVRVAVPIRIGKAITDKDGRRVAPGCYSLSALPNEAEAILTTDSEAIFILRRSLVDNITTTSFPPTWTTQH